MDALGGKIIQALVAVRSPLCTSSRTFSSSAPLAWKSHTSSLKARHANVPTYPYGPAQWYKQSNKGLYGTQMIRFGNNVGVDSKYKTRRAWHPNVVNRNLRSDLLGRNVRVRLTTRVLRSIDKAGGLDAYLLGNKQARLKDLGMEGWKLRCQLLQDPAYLKLANKEQTAVLHATNRRQREARQAQAAVEAGTPNTTP